MTWQDLASVGSPVAMIITGVLVFLNARTASRADVIQQTVDQLQEEVTRLRAEVTEVRTINRVLEDYTAQVRVLVPPDQRPPWPPLLITGRKTS